MNECLKTADLVVTLASTAGLEAIYNDIPMVIINPDSDIPGAAPFYKYFPCYTTQETFITFLNSLSLESFKKIVMPKDWNVTDFKEDMFKTLLKKNT